MFLKQHRERALALDVDVADALQVACESDDLSELRGNLIDNACRAARRRVRVHAQTRAGEVVIEIEDDGAGLDAAALAQLGERGRRFDEHAGFGLGVSISRDIAQSYDGSLEFSRSDLGALRARLQLPQPGSAPRRLRWAHRCAAVVRHAVARASLAPILFSCLGLRSG